MMDNILNDNGTLDASVTSDSSAIGEGLDYCAFSKSETFTPDSQESNQLEAEIKNLLTPEFYHNMQLEKGAKLVVAMSGGVDSSVTAALLTYAGYEVIGLTLQLYDYGQATAKKGACCAGQDIYDAKKVAAKLGIPHYVMDMESRFKESVIQDFADSYAMGETPIPCIRCNQTVKFNDLLKFAQDLGAEALATGHYIQRARGLENDQPSLVQGLDDKKDQSYFLFATTKAQLDYLRFPLGSLDKQQTRNLARFFNLSVAEKPDSQDICFVPDGNYAKIVERLRPDAFIPGNIVDMNGNIIGHHKGIANFTIGQRRGIGIGARLDGLKNENGDSEPYYVIALNPLKAEVVVGPRTALAIASIRLKDINWLGQDRLSDSPRREIFVKVRNIMNPIPASLIATTLGDIEIEFKELQYCISPGQACVFYQDDLDQKQKQLNNFPALTLLGGGWIC